MKNLSYLFISSTLITLVACSPIVEQQSEQSVQSPEVSIPDSISESAAKADVDKSQPAARFKKEYESKMVAPHVMNQAAKSLSGVAGDAVGQLAVPTGYRQAVEAVNRENYVHFDDNGIRLTREQPVSTFSVDVDTGSYTNVRRILNDGRLPPKDAVRVEEFINYFSYDEKHLDDNGAPFSVFTEVGPTPWNKNTRLMRVSLQSQALQTEGLASNNLVFLVDVSGSMRADNKLGLLKKSLKLLSRQMDKNDRISIVVYAGASGLVLETVAGNEQLKIEQAISQLEAGGSTNGAAGIQLAYQTAKQAFIPGGNNRVILATDGDFNVGTVNHDALLDLIEQQRKQGIFLTTLGFGTGNYNDHLMEQLADHGDGNYAYIDNLMEAKKVLVDEIGSTLQTVARDVKIQVEFNPEQVSEYRLIGYENRHLQREDFNNDLVDAGEIGAGHAVTALYELTLGSGKGSVDPLRYGKQPETLADRNKYQDELAYVKLRYKPLDSDSSTLLSFPVNQSAVKDSLQQTSQNYRFASAVAAFGQKLRGGKYLEHYTYQDMMQLAQQARGQDKQGLRGNFMQLVGLAQALDMNIASR